MARDVAGCVQMMRALDPGFGSKQIDLDETRVAIAWLEDADSSVALRVEEASACFPHRERIDFPRMPTNLDPVFWHEVAGVHAELFAQHADLYGENVRGKVERALRVADEDYEAGVQARNRYVNEAVEALEGFDLLLVPTIGTVAPPRTIPERKLRPPTLRFTEPFNALGWPALALPCGGAENGLPASVTLAAPRGKDDYVLDIGLSLEAALASAST
jgi:Asp-tRNA(Asn)/Glu-tRNA(Gln) amidotransferase A subunit family amidase